jgi:hypothetical protein
MQYLQRSVPDPPEAGGHTKKWGAPRGYAGGVSAGAAHGQRERYRGQGPEPSTAATQYMVTARAWPGAPAAGCAARLRNTLPNVATPTARPSWRAVVSSPPGPGIS